MADPEWIDVVMFSFLFLMVGLTIGLKIGGWIWGQR